MTDAMTELKTRLGTVKDLEAAAAVLDWDQETFMPDGATEARARQLATLQRMAHELFTGDDTARLLEVAQPASDVDADLIRVARRDLDRARRIPADLVADMAVATARAKEAWKRAREEDDFKRFEPHLSLIVDLCVRKAEAVGYGSTPYDALIDEYEPDMTTARVSETFAALRTELVPMVRTLSEATRGSDGSVLHRRYPADRQWDFGMQVMRDIGFDFHRGRQDQSAHPFTTTFSISDVRLTTRVHADHFAPAFFGSLHEAGHGMYEQGVDPALEGTLLADGTSLGIHESQSRLWENLVGRSGPFWDHYFPTLRDAFPEALGDVTLPEFVRAINHVQPSPVRIEADEVTYNLHIMVRFELETALVEGRLRPSEVPEAWNARMEEFLGIQPSTNAEGCLQDIHWSLGILGYFPTYALGNLMSAQLWSVIRREIPDLHDQIGAGEFAPLLGWLRTRVHRHGRRKSADEILRDVSGSGLRADEWLAYIREKFSTLFGVDL